MSRTQVGKRPSAEHSKCVNCLRCVLTCPTRALSIARWPQVDGGSAVWTLECMQDIAKQASSGGVLLSSMGNPLPYPVYWDRLLLNASQVTNPSIDPLREPMETRVFSGRAARRARGRRGQPHASIPSSSAGQARRARHVLRDELRLGVA